MANVKISQDLFLEKQELNRLKRFLEFDGFKQEFLLNTSTFGIVKGYNLPNGLNIQPKDSFRVNNVGASTNSVNIQTGRAVNKYADIITLDTPYTLQIPATNLWYWIKIKYKKVNYEVGTVNIDANGNLTGFGTLFTEVLRGQPNFPTKVKFTNSVSNNLEYEVVDVLNDGSALLSGDFVYETDLQYAVVGTFTPGFVPAAQNKLIYEYDNVEISLVAENPASPGLQPPKIGGEEFWLARVRTAGLNVEIQDKRTEFWQTRAEYEIHLISRFANPIIGVESVKWDIETQPRDRNEVNINWGYRTSNWSVDTTQNTVTINSGLGGILKENDVTDFINGFFDGWRLYVKSGKYFRIVSSTKTGTQLNLKLDYLDFSEFNSKDELHIVPDVEEIEIKATYDALTGVNHIITEKFLFPIHFSGGKCYVRIMDSHKPYLYNFTYRYKTLREYTDWFVFPNDKIGFYSEKSFDTTGTLNINPIDREQKPYSGSLTNGFIEIVPNPRNWNIFFEELMTGDKFGVDHKNLTNATPVVQLVVGQDRQMQVFHMNGLTLGNDIFINLNKIKYDGNPCINGNRFIIQLEGSFNLNSRNFRIVTDYVDPTNFTLIREIRKEDSYFVNQNQQKQRSGLVMIFSYDGTDWWLSISNEMNGVPKNTIIQYGGSVADFDSTGLGVTTDVLGWALCNGNYGTTDMRSITPVGYNPGDSDYFVVGNTGGSKTVQLNGANVPAHSHTFHGNTDWDGAHEHTVWAGNGSAGGGFDKGSDDDPRFYAHPDNANTSRHSHHFSGVTDVSGGSSSPNPIDVRMPWKSVLFIQKII